MNFYKQTEFPDRLPVANSVSKEQHAELSVNFNPLLNKIFYGIKPLVPRAAQLFIRRRIAKSKRSKFAHLWPIDPNAGAPPAGWRGWPEGKQFALVLSHDVDTEKGYRDVLKLADVEERLGFRSQFNFVPERYGTIDMSLLGELKRRGFGISVHGLKHDGKLFSSRKKFEEGAKRINGYLKQWGTTGFTTPSMICNHQWMLELDIDYSTSSFDTDPFEPEPGGVGTIFPYWVQDESSGRGFLELPYTLAQDFTLFVILGQETIDLWKQKFSWIASKGGMAFLNSHPDYMNFGGSICGPEEYPVQLYQEFLEHIRSSDWRQCWPALPQQVWSFWIQNMSHLDATHPD
jgi:hypothetical protein